MQENTTSSSFSEYKPIDNIKKAEKYLLKYCDELKRHLELTDEQIIKVSKNAYWQLLAKNTTKKWWNFFKK